MKNIAIGEQAPDFTLTAADGSPVSLGQFRGRRVLLYFYPKNMTPACTQEACDFRDAYPDITARDAVVIGISPDPAESHIRFIGKNSLPFILLSDPEHTVSELYGVWQLKKLYGREFMGIVRSTFLIDENGVLIEEWRNIRVKGHVDRVVERLGR